MTRYISLDAVLAEIERRKQDAVNNCGGFKSIREHECDRCIVEKYEEMEDIIDTLEVKEVDDELECKIVPRPIECDSSCKECPWLATNNKA